MASRLVSKRSLSAPSKPVMPRGEEPKKKRRAKPKATKKAPLGKAQSKAIAGLPSY